MHVPWKTTVSGDRAPVRGAPTAYPSTLEVRLEEGRRVPAGTLRIIAGRWRHRRIALAAGAGVRPTPDRVRETLFNWLAGELDGARCLDLFAGSGALGFEAASRGAARVVMVERDRRVAGHLREQARMLGAQGIEVVHAEAEGWLAGCAERFDLCFLDPPYAERSLRELCTALERHGLLVSGARVYLEGPEPLAGLGPGWRLLRSNKAGRVRYHLAAFEG